MRSVSLLPKRGRRQALDSAQSVTFQDCNHRDRDLGGQGEGPRGPRRLLTTTLGSQMRTLQHEKWLEVRWSCWTWAHLLPGYGSFYYPWLLPGEAREPEGHSGWVCRKGASFPKSQAEKTDKRNTTAFVLSLLFLKAASMRN